MPETPHLEDRPAVPYVAIAGAGTGEAALRAFADTSFPALFGWLAAHGAAPAAPPFFRFYDFVPDGPFDVEVGVTTTTPLARVEDGAVRLGELPAGRYAVHVHAGAYTADDERWAGRDLPAAHRHMDEWAQREGATWATSKGRWSASIECYLVGPGDTADVASWRTEIAKLVAT